MDDDMNLRVRQRRARRLPCICREGRHRLEQQSVDDGQTNCRAVRTIDTWVPGAFGRFDRGNDTLTSDLNFDIIFQVLAEILDAGLSGLRLAIH